MLNIYAQTFMTATRTNCVKLHEIPGKTKGTRKRWFSRRKAICIDPAKL
ncbi:MAG: hypothetical protein ABJL67_06400 [Sulfitobacter sp.]